MQISDLRSNSAFTYMTLTWELNLGGEDKMWTLLFQRSSAEFGRGERTLSKQLWDEVNLREKGNLPDCRIILETRVDIANAWQTTLPASNWECCREKKTTGFAPSPLLHPKSCMQQWHQWGTSKAMNAPGVLDGVLANSKGEKLKWLVRPGIYFTVFSYRFSPLFYSCGCACTWPSLRPTHRGKVMLMSRQRHLALLSSTSDCIHIFMGTMSKIFWKC